MRAVFGRRALDSAGRRYVLSVRRPGIPPRPQCAGRARQRQSGFAERPKFLPIRPMRTTGLPRHLAMGAGTPTIGSSSARLASTAMTLQNIATALERVQAVLRRRPDLGLHDDTPATASWESGVRVVSSNPNGTRIVSDLPPELGGGGQEVTPGWLFRAGVASCAATSIAMAAAAKGIELTVLDVRVTSRSDARGLFGMTDADGEVVYAGPTDMHMNVRIAARGATSDGLRAVVEEGYRCSPIPCAVQKAVPVALQIEVQDK